jgi:hypothetical protein
VERNGVPEENKFGKKERVDRDDKTTRKSESFSSPILESVIERAIKRCILYTDAYFIWPIIVVIIMTVTCGRSVVFYGYSGFLYQ